MPRTITYTGELTVHTCWCGIQHAIPSELDRWANQSGSNAVYCPLGHQWVIRKGEADQQRELRQRAEQEAVALRARLDQANADAEHQRNRVRGYQGALGKAKKRAAAGVCPAPGCKRHFANVAAHVARMHPDLAHAPLDVAVT